MGGPRWIGWDPGEEYTPRPPEIVLSRSAQAIRQPLPAPKSTGGGAHPPADRLPGMSGRVVSLAAVLFLAGAGVTGARADDPFAPDAPAGGSLSPEDAKKAKALFDEAVLQQEKREYQGARKKFKRFLEDYPGADPELRRMAEERSEENCFLGIEEIHSGGPSRNRIDVELMGDGYLLEQQEKFRKHAEDQLKEFWREPLYDEYESYFNVWRFDLASKEEGVDEVGPGGGGGPGADDPQKPKRRRPLKEYSTALNCKAAGPQQQVMADPDMVFKWRRYLDVSDGLSICFAKKGQLGMGGMGIATTGRRVAVVHEFGHAFVGLLDEYAVNPGPAPGRISAPNAVSGKGPKEPPDLKYVPWKHWLDAKNNEVGLFLGGATYELGVFRPAPACAMNSGGSSPYCWVCRETGVLRIYDYVNPIDDAAPADAVVVIPPGGRHEFSVVPMAPKHHRLSTDWWLEKVKTKTTTKRDDPDSLDEPADPEPLPAPKPARDVPALSPDGWTRGPARGFVRHSDPWPPGPPRGDPVTAKEKNVEGGQYRSTVVLENLPLGRYRLTAQVRDDAKVPNTKFPWVIRDPDKILEERREWVVIVGDAPR